MYMYITVNAEVGVRSDKLWAIMRCPTSGSV